MIETATPGLVLRPLTRDHAIALHHLVARNRAHLTAHGDYADLVALSPAALAAELDSPEVRELRYGIVLHGQLIGRIDLVPVAPPRYGLG
ncbi:hypothetical protein [Devosia sp.]|uniref:hypothetical protein n=1 Tax=Devosia sp. TaxID=1871048 RepID=UPI003A94C675